MNESNQSYVWCSNIKLVEGITLFSFMRVVFWVGNMSKKILG